MGGWVGLGKNIVKPWAYQYYDFKFWQIDIVCLDNSFLSFKKTIFLVWAPITEAGGKIDGR